MHALVKTAFMRLYALNSEEEERKLMESGGEQDGPEAKMTVTTDSQTSIAAEATEETATETEAPTVPEEPPEPKTEDKAEEDVSAEITRQQCKWTDQNRTAQKALLTYGRIQMDSHLFSNSYAYSLTSSTPPTKHIPTLHV